MDSDVLASAFSQVIDNTRVGPTPWVLAGGWNGENTCLGTIYAVRPREMDEELLIQTYNSDDLSTAPYGKQDLEDLPAWWARWNEKISNTIPICMAADNSKMEGMEANPHIRRSEYQRVPIQ